VERFYSPCQLGLPTRTYVLTKSMPRKETNAKRLSIHSNREKKMRSRRKVTRRAAGTADVPSVEGLEAGHRPPPRRPPAPRQLEKQLAISEREGTESDGGRRDGHRPDARARTKSNSRCRPPVVRPRPRRGAGDALGPGVYRGVTGWTRPPGSSGARTGRTGRVRGRALAPAVQASLQL